MNKNKSQVHAYNAAHNMAGEQVRVRIAPSPTGSLHIGTARTALFNYLFAKHNNGQFILRIENTDLERSKKEYEDNIINGLRWLGIEWDEGPSVIPAKAGIQAYGPYRQSERLNIYKKYIEQLLDKNLAYYCPCSEEELEKEKQEQMAEKKPLIHICPHKQTPSPSLRERVGVREGIIRFRTPQNQIIKFHDLIRGEVEFNSDLIGDFSIAKDLNTPLYNFAVIIDDYEMKISHIIRGEDHISNTPKQILLQQALGLPTPEYSHLPLILNPDRTKLSKRYTSVSIDDYREQGYLPEALVNFMALLGWNPGNEKEIFTLEELTKEFSIEKVGKSGAIFNLERLDWINGWYIRQLPIEKLTELCIPYLSLSSPRKRGSRQTNLDSRLRGNDIKKIVALEQERLKKLSEIGERTKYFFISTEEFEYDPALLKWKNMTNEEVKNSLQILCDILDKIPDKNFTAKKLKEIIMPEAEKTGDRGKLLWPMRTALSGLKASPDPFSIAEILEKEKTLSRLQTAINKFH